MGTNENEPTPVEETDPRLVELEEWMQAQNPETDEEARAVLTEFTRRRKAIFEIRDEEGNLL